MEHEAQHTQAGAEWRWIQRLTRSLRTAELPGVVNIGDDCAAWPHGGELLLLTCDAAVAGRHFTIGHTPWEAIGWRLATASVSDVAACGGHPISALVSVGLPQGLPEQALEAVYQGLQEAAECYGFFVQGGNISTAEQLFLDLFMLGRTAHFVPRGGAQPGDWLALSDVPGESEAGRRALLAATEDAQATLIARHLRPQARLDLVPLVAECAHAAIDVSDGLASELHHLARASGVRLEVERAAIPQSEALRRWCAAQGESALQLALSGGEDYALLVSVAPQDWVRMEQAGFQRIGQVCEGQGVCLDGEALALTGWDHLRQGASST